MLNNVLAIIVLLLFVILILASKNPRRTYLLFSICALPLIDTPVAPASMGSLKVFDAISYLVFFLLAQDFITVEKKSGPYYILYLLLTAFLVIGSLSSEFIVNSLLTLINYFPAFIFSKLLIDECYSDQQFQRNIIMLIKGVGIFSIIFIFIQYIVGLDFTFYTKLNPNTSGPDGFRYPSFFHDPQKYGQFIMILSFLYLPSNPKDISIKHVVPFLISICAMLLTGSRSALLGFGGGLVVLFIFLNTKIKILVGSLALIGSILFFFYSDLSVTLDRVSDFEHDYEFRSSVWKEAFEIFKKHPFLGIGSGNYQRFMEHYSTNQFFIYDNEIEFFDQPENGYLKILVEFGLFGFIIFLLFFLLPIIRSIPLSSNDTGGVTNYYFIAAIASWLIAFNSVYSIGDKRILLVLVCLLSLLVAYHKRNAAHEE